MNDTTIENEQVLSYKVGNDVTNLSYGLTRLNEDAIGYLSDSYGNIVQHGSETYAYTPYGELTQGIINGVNEAGYKGEVHDTSSLQYLRARTYHTKLKQFLSEDTVVGKDSHPLSQNRYAFVLNNPFKYSDPSGHIALPYLMEDRGGPITNYKSTTPPKIVQTVQKKPAAVPPSIQKSIQAEQNYQKAEVIQNNKNVKNTQEAQKIAVITDYLNRTGSSTYENGIGTNPSKTTSTSNSTITIGETTVSTGNSSSYSYTNEKYLKEDTSLQKQLKNDSWNIKHLVNAENSIFSNKNVTSVLSGLANIAFGGVSWSIGITALATIMTGGLALAPMLILGAIAGTSALYGLSNMGEGAHQVLLGANGKGGEKSYNVLRDTVFQGNSELYHTIGIGSSILTTGGMSGLSQGGTLVNMVKGMGKEVLKDAIGGGSGFLAGNAVYEATGSKILSGVAGIGAGLYTESSFNKLLNPVKNFIPPTTSTSVDETIKLESGTGKGMNNPVVSSRAKIGQEAHRQLELEEIDKWIPEQTIELPNGKTVRKDGVGRLNSNEVRIIKPDTPTGIKSAEKRAELMRQYGYKPTIDYYDPTDVRFQPGSPTYIGPKN